MSGPEPPKLIPLDPRGSLSAISPSVASSSASPAPEPDDSVLAAVAEKAQARARGDTQTGDKADDDSDDDEAFDQVPDFLRTNLLSAMSPSRAPATNSRAYVPSAMPSLDTGFDNHQTRNRRSSFEPSDRSNEEWEGVMIKTFTRWVNTCLIARGLHVSDLIVGLHDGVILVHLVEILSKKSLGRFNSSPRLTIQKLENVTKVLDFLRQGGAKMVNIGAQDVVFGNQKIILGLLWTLILKYQMDGHVDSSVKERLMAFVQEKCNKKYGLNVYNFSTCFQDGRAVSALTNALAPEGEPDPIDMNKMLPTPLQNIERAMHIAETVYGIPRVMDPQDLAERPDTHSVMTYVSFFLKKVSEEDQRRSAQQAAVEAAVRSWLEPKKCIVDGPGLGPEYIMGRPAYFTLHLKDKENKRFLPSSIVTGAAAQALLDKPKPPGGGHERKVSLSAVPPQSVANVPGSGHPSQPVLLIAQLDRVRKHSKSVRGSLPATLGPAPDAVSDAGSEAEVRSEAGIVSALLAVERDTSGSSLPDAPGPLEGEYLSDVMRPRSVTMPNVAISPAFRPFPSRLPAPVAENEEEDTCARLECRVLDNKDGTVSISYHFPALLREVKETLARAAEVDPELVAPERLDAALKQVKDAREAAGAEYMLRVELNGEPVASLPKSVRFAHDPELMAAMEEVETRVAAIRATVAERKRAREEAAEKNRLAQQEAEAARERAARAEEEATRLRKALEEAEETRRRAEAEQAERAEIERKQSEEHQRNETELQQQLLATAQREAEERARLQAAEEERARLAKALEDAEKERRRREAEARLDAEVQTDEARLLSQEADAGTQTDWFGLGEHDTVSAMEAERAQLARELESERTRADELGQQSLDLQTQLGEIAQRIVQLQSEREEAVANARARANSELERAHLAEEDAKRAAEQLQAEQAARAQLEQAQAERARRLEDKARARMEKRRRDAEERAQERVERQQLIEALQKAMTRLETVKTERDAARKDRDAWKAKYEQAVKDLDGGTPRSNTTERSLSKQRTLVGGSLAMAREDSKSELDLDNEGADDRLLRQKMRLRIKALEDGEKRSASELTLSNRRFEAQRLELRQVKTETAREIGNLRKELVDAQTELTGLRGESAKRQRLIDMAKQTLTGLQPWVGLEISAAGSRPSSRTNLHALAPSKSGSMAAISEDSAAREHEPSETDDAKSEAGSEAPSQAGDSDQRAGVLVHSVKTGGPAALAGFKKGDLIEQVDGEFTRSNSLLRAIIAKALPGDSLSFQVNRSGEMFHVTVRVGSKTLDYDSITELRRIASGIVRAGDEKYMRELKRKTFSKAEANSHIRLPGLASSDAAKAPSPSPSSDPLSPTPDHPPS